MIPEMCYFLGLFLVFNALALACGLACCISGFNSPLAWVWFVATTFSLFSAYACMHFDNKDAGL